jgi:hypothetical protein
MGVTAFDAADATLVPLTLVALTVKVYGVPLVRPPMLTDEHGALHEPTNPPGEDNTL